MVVAGLFIVGVIIILGIVAQYIFKRTKIPDVLILIAFGAILSFFNLAPSVKKGSNEITFLIIFSLIYVVFYGALPIGLKALFSTMKYAFISSLLNFIFVTGILGTISYFMGFGWTLGLSLGALFCVLDGSIINALLEIIHIGPRAEAQIQTESAIIDTLVIVGILSILNFSQMAFSEVLASLTSYLLLSFAIGFVAAIIWSFALKKVGDYGSAPIATMAILVILYAFGEYVKANGVITVFSFAIILSNISLLGSMFYRTQKESINVIDIQTKSFFKEISFLIRSFLFVYLGILVDFAQWPYLLVGLGFFLVAYFIRSVIGRYVFNKSLSSKQIYFLDAMCAKGLTPTVMLAVIGAQSAFGNIVVGGIFSSILITSIIIYLIDVNKFTSFSDFIFDNLSKLRYRFQHKH